MTREEAFAEINQTQEDYINQLVDLMNNPNYTSMKSLNFQSATGTGKTNMMALLINKFPDYYFIITTLSKGQLHIQIRDNLKKLSQHNNFFVYGSADYKINSRLDADDIIGRIPDGKKCIWLRDEGHIKTNRWDALLESVCYKVINFSATNDYADIQCNFAHTMMLRTVNQTVGTPEDAIQKLLEVKQQHSKVPNYNPCAIFRCVGGDADLYQMIVSLCDAYGLKYTDLSEDEYVMADLCRDDNEYDVLINKFKIVEGIDIRRAHILYMDNKPNNNATTIQVIGRCRRNALLYRDDIDILSKENEELLKNTRECYVYYNVEKMKIDEDENGELQIAFCNYISCQNLKANIYITVTNGQLPNGLYVLELEGQSGVFYIGVDAKTGFNVIEPETDFYAEKTVVKDNLVYVTTEQQYAFDNQTNRYRAGTANVYKIRKEDISKMPIHDHKDIWDWGCGGIKPVECPPYYKIVSLSERTSVQYPLSSNSIALINTLKSDTQNKVKNIKSVQELKRNIVIDKKLITKTITDFINDNTIDIYHINCVQHIEKYELGNGRTLNAVASEKELPIIQYFYIQKYRQGYSNTEIQHLFAQYCSIIQEIWRSKFNSFRHRCKSGEEESVSIALKKFGKEPVDFNSAKLTWLLLSNETYKFTFFRSWLIEPAVVYNYGETLSDEIIDAQITKFFEEIHNLLNSTLHMSIYAVSDTTDGVNRLINEFCGEFSNNCICVRCSYLPLLQKLTNDEATLVRNGYIKPLTVIPLDSKVLLYNNPYTKRVNDRESAIIGVDLMRQTKSEDDTVSWNESRSISSKVGKYNKLNEFITNKYQTELEYAKQQLFNGHNSFALDSKCNSVLGYCVEYYSKYLLYGEDFLSDALSKAKEESKTNEVTTPLIVRACMLKYKEMMVLCYGSNVAKVIKTISVEQLIKEKYRDFVSLVIELGTATANYVKETLYKDKPIQNDVDPNLTIQHIAGLADYITEDTILDVKVQNHIDEKMIRQVLAYHYLSTKRSDLNIKRVIVYDATSNKSVIIPISEKNIKQG